MSAPADLLPPSATKQERAVSVASSRAAYPETTDAKSGQEAVRRLWDTQDCPLDLLPWLAWSMGVEPWNPAWSESQKRDAIRAAIGIRRHKGTIGAIRRAIGALGHDAEVRENIGGVPFTFSIRVTSRDGAPVSSAVITEMMEVAERTKNARSHLVSILTFVDAAGVLAARAVSILGDALTVYPPTVNALESPAVRVATGYTHTVETLTV